MATELAKAYVQIIPSAEGISDNISKALGDGESVGKDYGTKLGSGISSALKMGGAAVAGLGAAAVGLGKSLLDGANAASQMGDNIDKTSQKIGISAKSYQEWAFVFERSGANVDNLQVGMKKLSGVISDATSGSAQAAEKLSAVGLSIDDLNGKSQDEQLSLVISALQGMEQGADRTTAATDLLGKSAIDMAAVLNMSAEDTEALKQQVNDLGGVMSNEAVAASAAFQDSLTNFQTALTGAKNGIVGDMLPALTDLTNGFAQLLAGDTEGAYTLLTDGIKGLADTLTSTIPDILGVVGEMANAVMEVAPSIITSLAEGIISALPELTPTLVELIVNITQQLIELLPQLIEAGMQIVLQLALGLAEALPELIPSIIDVVLTITETLIDNIDLLIDGAIALIMGLTEGLINALPLLIERTPEIVMKLVDALIDNAPKLLEAGLELIVTLAGALITYTPQLLAKVPEMIGQLVSKFASLKDKFMDIGKNIVDGIKEGLAKAWNKIIDWLKEKCGEMIDTVKSFFGIHSPSTVFRDQVGFNLAAGIGVGFSDEMENVNKMIDDSLESEFDLATNVNLASSLSEAQPVNNSVNENNSIGELLNKLNEKLDNIGQQKIVLDSGVLVGETASLMNDALGIQARREAYA